MPDHRFGFDTLCLHAGQIPDAQTGARVAALAHNRAEGGIRRRSWWPADA